MSVVHEGLDPIEVPGMTTTLDEFTREGLDAFWDRFKATGDPALRDRLTAAYTPLIFYCEHRVGWLPRYNDASELSVNGMTALREAVEEFDIDGQVGFETFALARIRSATRPSSDP